MSSRVMSVTVRVDCIRSVVGSVSLTTLPSLVARVNKVDLEPEIRVSILTRSTFQYKVFDTLDFVPKTAFYRNTQQVSLFVNHLMKIVIT